MVTAAEEEQMGETRAEARTRLTREVARLLAKDRQPLVDARRRTEKAWSTAGLEPDVLEQKLVNAALDKLMQRRAAGQDISAVYPAFKDYVPPFVYGKGIRGDQERQELIELQLDIGYGRVPRRDVESDDEEPNPYLKKEEGEETPTTEDSGHRQSMNKYEPLRRDLGMFSKSAKAALPIPKQQTESTASPRHRSVTEPSSENENDEYESNLSDLESSSEEDSESASDSEDDSPVTLVAVLRGQPIREDLTPPEPSKSAMRRRKHRPTKTTNNALVAVLRGEIVQNHDLDVEWVWMEKKGFAPKKRVRGGGGGGEAGPKVETQGQENKHKNKKARVEAGV
jgi:hypothetical protein